MSKREAYNDLFAENQWAHYLIRRIDLSKQKDAILAILTNTQIKKKPLTAVINYLKTSFGTDYPQAVEALSAKKSGTKSEMFGQIIHFVELTLPHSCLTCESDYSPYTQNRSETEVTCFLCTIPAHEACVKEEHIAKKRGIVYICQNCLLMKGKPDPVIPDSADKPHQSSSSESSNTASDDEASDKDKPKPTKEAKDKAKHKKTKYTKKKSDTRRKSSSESTESENSDDEWKRKRYKNICKLYQQGICPFGRSGRECSKQHPPHCRRWCSYGADEWGCKWGDECWFFHPELCEHAVKLKKCMDLDCPKIHIKGTQRYEQRLNEDDFNQYSPRYRQYNTNETHDTANQHYGYKQNNSQEYRNSRYNQGNSYGNNQGNSYGNNQGNSYGRRDRANPNFTNRVNQSQPVNSNSAYQEIKPFLDKQLGDMMKELQKSIADQLRNIPQQLAQQQRNIPQQDTMQYPQQQHVPVVVPQQQAQQQMPQEQQLQVHRQHQVYQQQVEHQRNAQEVQQRNHHYYAAQQY